MKLSVCIPTWNRCEFLRLSLSRTVEQMEADGLFDQVEISISDNGSDDGTAALIDQIRAEHERVAFRVHRFETNQGYARNMDEVIRNATGEFVFLNGDDDCFIDGGLKRLIEQCQTIEGPAVVLKNLWNFQGNLDWDRVPENEQITFANVAECVDRLGPFHLSFIGNFVLRRQAYLDHSQQRYLDSIYPHTAVLFDVLRASKVEFRNFSCIEVDDSSRRLGPTAARGTAIDMARVQTDGYLCEFAQLQDCFQRYVIFLRSLPRAVLYERVGMCQSSSNPYQNTTLTNVRQCYRASARARWAATLVWLAARYLPVRFIKWVIRERVTSS